MDKEERAERDWLIFSHHQAGCSRAAISKELNIPTYIIGKVITKGNKTVKSTPRFFVRDHLDNVLPLPDLAKMINKQNSQISAWITKYGFTTLRQVIDRKSVYSGVTGTKLTLSDKDGNIYSCKQAAKVLRFAASKIRYEYKVNGCDTLEKFIERMKNKKANRTTLKTYKTVFGDLNVHEILAKHPDEINITTKTIYGRLSRRGGMCPSLWWDKMPCKEFADKLIEERLVPSAGVIKLDPKKRAFNRSETCYRENHTERCKHYFDLTETFVGKKRDRPEICQGACGDECKHYEGELIGAFVSDKWGGALNKYTSRHCGVNYTAYTRV